MRNCLFLLRNEKDEDGVYVVECPLFQGCYTRGSTLDEALKNIREVIGLVLEKQENRDALSSNLKN